MGAVLASEGLARSEPWYNCALPVSVSTAVASSCGAAELVLAKLQSHEGRSAQWRVFMLGRTHCELW